MQLVLKDLLVRHPQCLDLQDRLDLKDPKAILVPRVRHPQCLAHKDPKVTLGLRVLLVRQDLLQQCLGLLARLEHKGHKDLRATLVLHLQFPDRSVRKVVPDPKVHRELRVLKDQRVLPVLSRLLVRLSCGQPLPRQQDGCSVME